MTRHDDDLFDRDWLFDEVDEPAALDMWNEGRLENARLRRKLDRIREAAERLVDGPCHAEASLILELLDSEVDDG